MKEKNLNKRLTIELPASKHKEIKLAATALGISMKELIDMAVQEKILKEMKEKR